ncbi:MAG: SCO family protein [Myxococcaceae bacterium]|nr:SCO family protein [Myxococcaceae bacterium]
MSSSPESPSAARPRLPLLLASLARRPAFWALLVVVGVGLPALTLVKTLRASRAQEVLGTLPTFRFTSQEGSPFGTAELAGKVWVANFIFTRCPTVCPVFSAKMARVQEQSAGLGPALRLVSFSVDPEYDTPERLKAYAARYKADPARWTFLTGEYRQLQRMVVDGFKVAMGREDAADDEVQGIFHGEYFVLVDGQGGIRGYYDSKDADAVERLLKDAAALVGPGRS